MPTSARGDGGPTSPVHVDGLGTPLPGLLFSTISCAIRTRVRRMSSRSRTIFSSELTRTFLASQDLVKGTDASTLATRVHGIWTHANFRGRRVLEGYAKDHHHRRHVSGAGHRAR